MTQDTHDSDDDQHASPAGPAEDETGYLPTTRRTFLGTIAAASAMGGGNAGVAAQGGGAGALAQEAASSHGYGVSSYGEGPYGGEAVTVQVLWRVVFPRQRRRVVARIGVGLAAAAGGRRPATGPER